MKMIVCLDNGDGMLFNHRRQSRDANVIKDIETMTHGKTVFVNSFSEMLFAGTSVTLHVTDNFLSEASNEDFCFIENIPIKQQEDQISKLIIYKWNRDYPSDFQFDIDYRNDFKLESAVDFVGTSHDKITKEVYIR